MSGHAAAPMVVNTDWYTSGATSVQGEGADHRALGKFIPAGQEVRANERDDLHFSVYNERAVVPAAVVGQRLTESIQLHMMRTQAWYTTEALPAQPAPQGATTVHYSVMEFDQMTPNLDPQSGTVDVQTYQERHFEREIERRGLAFLADARELYDSQLGAPIVAAYAQAMANNFSLLAAERVIAELYYAAAEYALRTEGRTEGRLRMGDAERVAIHNFALAIKAPRSLDTAVQRLVQLIRRNAAVPREASDMMLVVTPATLARVQAHPQKMVYVVPANGDGGDGTGMFIEGPVGYQIPGVPTSVRTTEDGVWNGKKPAHMFTHLHHSGEHYFESFLNCDPASGNRARGFGVYDQERDVFARIGLLRLVREMLVYNEDGTDYHSALIDFVEKLNGQGEMDQRLSQRPPHPFITIGPDGRYTLIDTFEQMDPRNLTIEVLQAMAEHLDAQMAKGNVYIAPPERDEASVEGSERDDEDIFEQRGAGEQPATESGEAGSSQQVRPPRPPAEGGIPPGTRRAQGSGGRTRRRAQSEGNITESQSEGSIAGRRRPRAAKEKAKRDMEGMQAYLRDLAQATAAATVQTLETFFRNNAVRPNVKNNTDGSSGEVTGRYLSKYGGRFFAGSNGQAVPTPELSTNDQAPYGYISFEALRAVSQATNDNNKYQQKASAIVQSLLEATNGDEDAAEDMYNKMLGEAFTALPTVMVRVPTRERSQRGPVQVVKLSLASDAVDSTTKLAHLMDLLSSQQLPAVLQFDEQSVNFALSPELVTSLPLMLHFAALMDADMGRKLVDVYKAFAVDPELVSGFENVMAAVFQQAPARQRVVALWKVTQYAHDHKDTQSVVGQFKQYANRANVTDPAQAPNLKQFMTTMLQQSASVDSAAVQSFLNERTSTLPAQLYPSALRDNVQTLLRDQNDPDTQQHVSAHAAHRSLVTAQLRVGEAAPLQLGAPAVQQWAAQHAASTHYRSVMQPVAEAMRTLRWTDARELGELSQEQRAAFATGAFLPTLCVATRELADKILKSGSSVLAVSDPLQLYRSPLPASSVEVGDFADFNTLLSSIDRYGQELTRRKQQQQRTAARASLKNRFDGAPEQSPPGAATRVRAKVNSLNASIEAREELMNILNTPCNQRQTVEQLVMQNKPIPLSFLVVRPNQVVEVEDAAVIGRNIGNTMMTPVITSVGTDTSTLMVMARVSMKIGTLVTDPAAVRFAHSINVTGYVSGRNTMFMRPSSDVDGLRDAYAELMSSDYQSCSMYCIPVGASVRTVIDRLPLAKNVEEPADAARLPAEVQFMRYAFGYDDDAEADMYETRLANPIYSQQMTLVTYRGNMTKYSPAERAHCALVKGIGFYDPELSVPGARAAMTAAGNAPDVMQTYHAIDI